MYFVLKSLLVIQSQGEENKKILKFTSDVLLVLLGDIWDSFIFILGATPRFWNPKVTTIEKRAIGPFILNVGRNIVESSGSVSRTH
jgi:hypothetical protein